MNRKDDSMWGIDLGGTKIEGVVLESAETPNVIFRGRVSTEPHLGYEHILNQVKKLVDKMVEATGCLPERIGLGTPGALIPHLGVMKNSNAEALNGKPMKKDLEALLKVKLEMANDANCFALAETRLGVVKERFPEAKVIFGVIMGTGVGGGLVINDHIVQGFHGIGGEWGHNYLNEKDGKPCYCGKTGCNESMLSGPALERYYHEISGVKKSMIEIVALAKEGADQAAVDTLKRLYGYFGRALSVPINIIDPDVIVIGGGLGNIDELYTEGLAGIQKYVFNNSFEAPVVKPSLGDSAGVFGAAYLVN